MALWQPRRDWTQALKDAVEHNCGAHGCSREQPCTAHQMLNDESTLNHFAFVDRQLTAYILGEWDVDAR